MERRGQVTRVLTNYGQLETGGTEWLERKVKPSRSDTSRVTGDSQARFCEGLGVKFPGPTRPGVEPTGLGTHCVYTGFTKNSAVWLNNWSHATNCFKVYFKVY